MKSVYLDQNVFGHLPDKGDWKTHPIGGKVLDDHEGDVGVWVSPTHVIELSQATNHARRSALARLMLELCGSQLTAHSSQLTAHSSQLTAAHSSQLTAAAGIG